MKSFKQFCDEGVAMDAIKINGSLLSNRSLYVGKKHGKNPAWYPVMRYFHMTGKAEEMVAKIIETEKGFEIDYIGKFKKLADKIVPNWKTIIPAILKATGIKDSYER